MKVLPTVTLTDLHNFYVDLTLTSTQEPRENNENMKSICRSFLKVLEDYKLYYIYIQC